MPNWINGKLKVGLIVPSVQVVTEPLYYKVAGEECEFFTTRVHLKGGEIQDLLEMEESLPSAILQLSTAKVDIIAYCCTASGALLGNEHEQELCRQVQQEIGVPMVTTMLSVLEVLKHLKTRKIALASPNTEPINEAESAYFTNNQFEVVSDVGMGISDGFLLSQISPEEITRFALEHWQERADVLFMSCMNWHAMSSVAEIEANIKKPVITSHSATLWNVFRVAGKKAHWPEFGSWMLS